MITTSPPERVSIMGVDVVPFRSYTHASDYIESVIESGQKSCCVAINPEKIHRAHRDPEIKAILQQADIGICDGVGISLAARLLYGHKIKRCTGIDLFLNLIDHAAQKGWKVFLLGASAESNETAYRKLLEMYGDLQIVGRHHGYFEDTNIVIDHINAADPDIVFVGMGSPKQEKWISANRRFINAAFCMGVGGSFDIIAGKTSRAPKFFRKTGTEFLYRLFAQPKRWKRQLSLPRFAWAVLKAKVFGLKYRS